MPLRVTGGEMGGRLLRAPKSGLRPTSDRVREAIFARLDVTGAAVLDLYAGSGALGIEALSRGAKSVVFVERAPRCVAALQANIESLGLEASATIVVGDVGRSLRTLPQATPFFDLVLLDPPYAFGEGSEVLAELVEARIMAPGGVVVFETGRRHPVTSPPELEPLDERIYGDTLVARFIAS